MMEIKSIESLSITECCEQLSLRREDLPDALQTLTDVTGQDELLVERLRLLLNEDRFAIEKCESIEQYERYLSHWRDGLYRDFAKSRIEKLKADEVELDFYKKNKDSISGCVAYLQEYPNGKFADEVKHILDHKRKFRTNLRVLIVFIAIVIAVIVCLMNYSAVSYLDVPECETLDKRGGSMTMRISTDADEKNIDVKDTLDWITVTRDKDILLISAKPNTGGKKSADIVVDAYSSFFGYKFNRISKVIEINQKSGLPKYLKTNLTEVRFDKYGNSPSTQIIAKTDGCDLQVLATESWYTVSKNIKVNDNDMIASITVSTGVNNEGNKTGEVVVSCNDYVKRIKVSQASGLATYFKVKQSSLDISEEGDKHFIDVYTDGTSWTVKSVPSWITATQAGSRLAVSADVNNGKIKTGIITLMSNNGDLRDISVTQDGDPTNFRAAKSSVKFDTDWACESITIYNDSHKSLSVIENESWLSTSVTNKNQIKIYCDSNKYDPPKEGTVYVRCGNEQISINVKQKGWKKCNTCGGNGTYACPMLNTTPWTTQFGSYMYTWENGRHVLRRGYTSWTAWGPVPKVEDTICSYCDGKGHIDCDECKGKGKIKTSN